MYNFEGLNKLDTKKRAPKQRTGGLVDGGMFVTQVVSRNTNVTNANPFLSAIFMQTFWKFEEDYFAKTSLALD